MWERFETIHGTVVNQEIIHYGETKIQAKKFLFFEIFGKQPTRLVGNAKKKITKVFYTFLSSLGTVQDSI